MRRSAAWLIALLSTQAVLAGDAGMDRANTRPNAQKLAARIDARLETLWSKSNIPPVARADDGEFLRRVSLDLVGRIPTAAEARNFLDDPDPEKRAALVDRLVNSPAFAARSARIWTQRLLPATDDQAPTSGNGFEAWIGKKIAEEAGDDRIVREILAARLGGRDAAEMMAAQSEPTPAAFFAAKGGKPETLASDTARSFLGIRLECAQCHDHPFAAWKREEFWQFAAFFSGVPQQADADAVVPIRMAREDANRHEIAIPGTSKTVQAAHLDHTPPAWRPRAGTRDVLAEWVTAPENRYFARAAVNRLWARFFGVGLIDPVDDLDAEGDPALMALLDELATAFREHNHDQKFLIRTLTATRAYNLSSAVPPGTSTVPPMFARMPVRGLSPLQFVDSLSQATGSELGETRSQFLELFNDRDEQPTESQTSILQALSLMNGRFVAAATRSESGDLIGAIAEAPYLDTAGRVEILFLATLTRRPRPEETALIVSYIDRNSTATDRSRALSDAFWAILNGPEFRTNH